MRLCSFPGCTNKFDSYNLCRSHRLQQIRGIELRPIKKLRPKGYYPCKFDGCDHIQNSVKLGLCSGHESQLKRGWTELKPLRPMNKKGTGLNPERRQQALVARYERVANAPGFHTAEQLAARLAYYGHRCVYCGVEATEVDHRIPLSRGGSAWPANLVPACKPCNCSKNNMPYREWMEKIAA